MEVTMRRLLFALSALALAIPCAASRYGNQNMSVSVDDGNEVTSCNQLSVRFDDGRGVRAEEVLPTAGLRSLKVDSARNGGIHVVGTDANTYSVTACKAADVEETLRGITTRISGNEVSADGPDSGNWVVFFLVRSPRNATMDLQSHNGPISLDHVIGTVTAHAANGPISLKGSSGTMDISTQNGPISLGGGSGTMKLNATNGPISVKFDGTSWDGDLEAHTQNGPLSVKVPRGFRSGMVVQSAGHSPVSCRAEACHEAKRTFDDDDNRRIEFGFGATVVRLSTVNGPVSVKEND
jgi:putative adhesin